ncbi:MAG: phosphotransferase family protein, partial [Sciscionella sp.]
ARRLDSWRRALTSPIRSVAPNPDGLVRCARIPAVLPDQARHWLLDVFGDGSRILQVRRFVLGGWHVNHAVNVRDRCGDVHRVVLRRWARPGWELDDPDYTVAREVRVLGLLGSTEIPAPSVIASDLDGARCDVPAVLLTRLPGHPPTSTDSASVGFCHQLAETLAAIHDLDPGAEPWLDPYRLYYERADAVLPGWIPVTPIWRRAIASVRQPPPAQTVMALIHRDYHPENTLWSRRRLTGVVDWTQASSGPPGLDVGHMRWNLVLDHGQTVADTFLASYWAATGRPTGDQGYWDLVSLFDLLLDVDDGPGDITPDDLRLLESHAAAALTSLG